LGLAPDPFPNRLTAEYSLLLLAEKIPPRKEISRQSRTESKAATNFELITFAYAADFVSVKLMTED